MTKIKVEDDRYFPTLGITAVAGDEVEVPEEAFPAAVVDSPQSKSKKEVIADGTTPQ